MSDGASTDPVVGVLLYAGCIVAEVIEPASRLAREGATVEWISIDGHPIADESGLVLTPSTSLELCDPTRFHALLVPGGDPGSIIGNPSVQRLVTSVADRGLVAAICGGVLVLGDAGVLAGRRITHNYRAPWSTHEVADFVAPLLAGAEIEPDPSIGVVVDPPVITALPNAAAEFSIKICQQLGVYDEQKATRLIAHLQGQYVAALFE